MALAPGGDSQAVSEELLQWSIDRANGSATVFLAGELDLSSAESLAGLLAELLEEEPLLVAVGVEMSRVSFLDSSGVKCLIDAATSAARTGCGFVVQSPTRAIRRVFEICGVDDLLLHDPRSCAAGDR